MKSVYFLAVTIVISTVVGCNKFKSDHPQTEISSASDTDLNANGILTYANTVDDRLSSLEKNTSLVLSLGDVSFYVERFKDQGRTVLIVEHLYNGGVKNSIKSYYLRNDSLLLEKEESKLANESGTVFKHTRTFLRNNTTFKVDSRTATSESAIKTQPFIAIPLSNTSASDHTTLDNLKSLVDVIEGKDKFDMVFENITTYPDARYIILSNKIANSYTASILVKQKDPLIDSLLNDPINFKNEKLNINWEVKDHEAVYIPVKK